MRHSFSDPIAPRVHRPCDRTENVYGEQEGFQRGRHKEDERCTGDWNPFIAGVNNYIEYSYDSRNIFFHMITWRNWLYGQFRDQMSHKHFIANPYFFFFRLAFKLVRTREPRRLVTEGWVTRGTCKLHGPRKRAYKETQQWVIYREGTNMDSHTNSRHFINTWIRVRYNA